MNFLRAVVSIALVGAVAFLPNAALASAHIGDSLSIKVYNHPELSRTIKVDGNGNISLPIAGTVNVLGLSESMIASRIESGLKQYVIYPAVSVETVAQGESLFVSGGPGGVLKYEPGETLSAALSDALQIGPTANQAANQNGNVQTKLDGAAALERSRIDLSKVGLRRDARDLGLFDVASLSANGQTGPTLQAGDTIVLSYKPILVRVLGDVAQPGNAYLASDQSLSEAIVQAGGLLPTAVSNRVELKRGGATQLLALGDPAFTRPAESGDVITIPEAPRVTVAGMVTNPGPVTLRTDFTLLSAMYTAGGPTKWANLKDVQIIRNGVHTSYDVVALTHGDLSQNAPLKDGDTVLVPEGHKVDFSPFFNVLGGLVPRL